MSSAKRRWLFTLVSWNVRFSGKAFQIFNKTLQEIVKGADRKSEREREREMFRKVNTEGETRISFLLCRGILDVKFITSLKT